MAATPQENSENFTSKMGEGMKRNYAIDLTKNEHTYINNSLSTK